MDQPNLIRAVLLIVAEKALATLRLGNNGTKVNVVDYSVRPVQ